MDLSGTELKLNSVCSGLANEGFQGEYDEKPQMTEDVPIPLHLEDGTKLSKFFIFQVIYLFICTLVSHKS